MSRQTAAGAVFACLALACSDPSSLSDQIFQQNKALWEDTGPPSYEFDLLRICLCDGPAEAIRITVQNGVVTRTYVATGAPLESQFDSEYPDIPGLFDLVESVLQSKPPFITVGYDDDYGFPDQIIFDRDASRNDDNRQYSATNFTPM